MDLENSKALKLIIKEEIKKALTEQAKEIQLHLRGVDRRIRAIEEKRK